MFFIKITDNEKLLMEFQDQFILGIPKTGHQNKRLKWFSTDNKESLITPFNNEISYNFNEFGYRCEPINRKEIVVLTIGCSISFGNGVPEARRFSHVFCNMLASTTGKTVSDWNLSWPGVSGNYVSRMVSLVIPFLKPDILLTTIPHLPRREFFDAQGQVYAHRPIRRQHNDKERDFYHHFLGLTSDFQDAYNLYTNYKLIELTTKQENVKWLFSIKEVDMGVYQKIQHLCDDSIRSESMRYIDLARDNGHPGVNAHIEHAKNYFAKYQEKYEMDN